MPDVSTFNLAGQDITVRDDNARSTAQSANTKATEASTTATKALQKVEEVENLSRVTVSYDQTTATITITTGTHKK